MYPALQLAFVPVLQTAFMLMGYFIGILSAKLSGAPKKGEPILSTMCCFSNVVGMPLPLVLSLVGGMPKYAGNPAAAQSSCLTYLFMANIAAATWTWTCAAPRLPCCPALCAVPGAARFLRSVAARHPPLCRFCTLPESARVATILPSAHVWHDPRGWQVCADGPQHHGRGTR